MTRNVALIYVRVSRLDREDRDKARNGNGDKLRALSPTTQIEQCKALPALQGMKVEVFEDLHKSGKNTKRPGLDRMRERLHDPDVALVAVWSISRLGRSVADLSVLLEEFQKAGVGFVSAKESIDATSASGRAFLGFLEVLAQFERELTSERMQANVENAARGGALVGQLPAGYRRDESGAVVIDEAPAAVVRQLFDEYATGKHSFRSLAIWANDQKLAPPQKRRRPGGPERAQLEHFTIDSIRDLLCNQRYTGRFVYRRRLNPDAEPIKGTYPALVDQETWDRCVELRRAARTARLIPSDRRVTTYALTGLLRCGACGDNVRGDLASGHGGRRYVCRRRRAAGLCHEPQVKADALETEIRQWLEAIRVRPEWAEFYAAQREGGTRRAPSSAERAKALEAKLDRLRVSWEAGAITDEAVYRREVGALRGQISAARTVREATPMRQAQVLNSLVDQWDVMTAAQRKRLVSTVFSEVTMRNKAIESARPHPDWARYVEEALTVCQTWARRDSNPHALSSNSS